MCKTLFPHQSRPDGGFTLIELLVSLALLALLLVFIAGGIRATNRAWDQVNELEVAGTTESVRSFLQRELSEAMQRYYTEPNGARFLTFGGETNGLTFVGPAPIGSGQFGLSAFSLDVIRAPRSGSASALALSQISYRPNIAHNLVESAPRRVLLDNIEAISIRYFGSLEQGEEPQWHQEWNSSRYLPQLVSIDVTFPPDDPRDWPTLVVELRLAVQPG